MGMFQLIGHHLPPNFASACREEQGFPGFVGEINMGVIQVEAFFCQIHNSL